MKIKPGNKSNSILNGEYAMHVRKWCKKFTSHKRRMKDKKIIKKSFEEI